MSSDTCQFLNRYILSTTGLDSIPYTFRKKSVTPNNPWFGSFSLYLVTLSDLRQIIFFLCSGKEEPGDDLKEELAIFFQNSGAVTGFICFHDSVLQIIPHPGKNPDFSPNIIPVSSFKTDGIITEHALIAEELSQYLENLHKIVSRIFYQIFGENEKKFRERTILSGILEIILTHILLDYGIDENAIKSNENFQNFIYFGSTIPVYLFDERNISSQDQELHSKFIEEASHVKIPKNLRIGCIDPVIFIRALHLLLKRKRTLQKRKKDDLFRDCDISSLTSSPVFHLAIQEVQKNHSDIADIIDPNSGTGELVLLFLRLRDHTEKSPLSRMENLTSSLFCSDPSYSSIMITRFGLVLHLLNGEFPESNMSNRFKNEIFESINSHIRVGDTLYTKKIQEEFISEQEARSAIYAVRPQFSGWPCISSEKPGLIITAPCRQTPLIATEIRQYLCKSYSSYSQEAMTSLYVAENAIRNQTYSSFIFLPASWLSDHHAGPFRRMVQTSRITHLIIEESSRLSKTSELWSCIITGNPSSSIKITRIHEDGTSTVFYMDRLSLPKDDGWSLEDPTGTQILTFLETDFVPLSEYCLGALYKPTDISCVYDGIWISLKITDDKISTISGEIPDPNANIIIRGPDFYLEGILQSPLIQWYWKFISHTHCPLHSDILIQSIPIHQPDWFDQDERDSVRKITSWMKERTFLLRRLNCARAYHDKKRIQRHLQKIGEELHAEICQLYQIPESFQDWVLQNSE